MTQQEELRKEKNEKAKLDSVVDKIRNDRTVKAAPNQLAKAFQDLKNNPLLK